MSGSGAKPISSESPRLSTIRINQSAYGAAITWLRGTNRVSGNLIDYDDFTAIPHTTTQEMGGKGGSSGGMKSTTYTYTCAVAIALSEGTVQGVGQVWSSKDKTTLGALGLTLFTGTLPQSPWGYMTSKHPTKALGYPGIAYVASGALDLGDSAMMPNLSFEVIGPRAIGELVVGQPLPDARADEILTDMLTDPLSGVGFDGARLHGLTAYRTYCQAAGFFVSPAISEQAAAVDHVRLLMQMTNADTVWSEGKLKIVPYADSAVTGNGTTYTPDVTPLFDLTDDDFIPLDDLSVIRINRKRPADAFNRVQVEFCNRAIEYNTDLGEARDGANIAQFGLRPKDPVQMHWITRKEMADQVADLIMRRELYILNEYEVKLGWRYAMLEAMDIITLTHAPLGLNRATVRIISADESEDGEIDLVVEEMPWAIATPAKVITQGGTGTAVDFNVAPGNSNTPVIFEPPLSLAGQPEIWFGTSGGSTWGGCEIWVSLDNATYTRIGNVTSPARHGTLTALMPSGSDPDVSTTVAVDLGASRATLLSGTQQDRDLLNTLCYVDGELISYQDATLTGSFRYDLTSLRRGAYGSPVGSHANGAAFMRLDSAVFRYAFDKSYVGETLYIKLRSFNIYGGALQDLATLTPITFAIAGAPVGSVGGLVAEQPFTGTSARVKWNTMDGAVRYKVEVWAVAAMRRSVETTDTRFAYSFEDAKADGGPWRTVQFQVYGITDTGLSTTPATLQLTNSQIATPTAVSTTALLEGLGIRCAMPTDTDYAGCRVHASLTASFTPDGSNLVYDGTDTNFAWYGLNAGDTWFLRIGCYDVFGADSIAFSSEQSVTVRGISADPATMLGEINTLLTDGSGAAIIKMLADRFSIEAPDGTKTPFAVVDAGGGVYKILLNADVLIGGNVDIANLTTGSLPSDVIMRLGGGTVEIDGMGEIRVYAGLGANQDFVRLTAAQINFMRYIAGTGYVAYNYLSRLEAGQANSGDTVTIPGYWKQQPKVMVSPAGLALFKKDYVAQDQSISCLATALQETATGSGVWQFGATATLNLAANTGTTAVNESSGVITANTFTSSTKTTASNCATIMPTVAFLSSRGNGTSQYYHRSVRWRVEYYSGGTWLADSYRVVNIGDQTSVDVTDSYTFTFPSAAAWQWRIYAESYDTDGTVFGSLSYTYTQETVYGTDISPGSYSSVATNSTGRATYSNYSSPVLSGEIYEITYNATLSVTALSSGTTEFFSHSIATWAAAGTFYDLKTDGTLHHVTSGNAVIGTKKVSTSLLQSSTAATWAPGAQSSTVSGSNLTFHSNYFAIGCERNFGGTVTVQVKQFISAMSAVVKHRTVVTNSTTPANTFKVQSFNYSLTSAQVLASGSLNWLAVGQ